MRRTSNTHPQVLGSRRPRRYCPRLETLEDRLPPGDTLLGLLGGPLPLVAPLWLPPWSFGAAAAGALPGEARPGREGGSVEPGSVPSAPSSWAARSRDVYPEVRGGDHPPSPTDEDSALSVTGFGAWPWADLFPDPLPSA